MKKKYLFSVPMPFDKQAINDLVKLNETLNKSKVSTLYNNFPFPFTKNLNDYFSLNRGINENIKSFEDFRQYVEYAQEKGFHFVYLMNSPKNFSEDDFKKIQNFFFELMDFLCEINCTEIKFSNFQVINIINKYYPNKFDYSVSTTCEYSMIEEYKNLITKYPNIRRIIVSYNQNQNFLFLKNLKKIIPGTKIEVMLNEPCIKGCPGRTAHFSSSFHRYDCFQEDQLKSFCKSSRVYPWTLEYYSKCNINSFKLVPFPLPRATFSDIRYIKNYLYFVEGNCKNVSANYFFSELWGMTNRIPDDIKLSEIQKLLPDVKYFVENGYKCSSICNIDCSYCDDCAKKLNKRLKQYFD